MMLCCCEYYLVFEVASGGAQLQEVTPTIEALRLAGEGRCHYLTGGGEQLVGPRPLLALPLDAVGQSASDEPEIGFGSKMGSVYFRFSVRAKGILSVASSHVGSQGDVQRTF